MSTERGGPHVRFHLVLTAGLLALGLLPPGGLARPIWRSMSSPEVNRADRDTRALGYYEDLIDNRSRNDAASLSERVFGRPEEWKNFHDIGATRYLRNDYLQFELRANLDRRAFGARFTTNEFGMRDRHYDLARPKDVIRVALLGSSIDMGWGVDTEETYENRLEDWLNAHAARRGVARRFEVLNFAMAAYSPLHRLEVFRRKVLQFEPDLVLYSATMLDHRLLEIQLCLLLQDRIRPPDEFVRRAIREANFDASDLQCNLRGELREKERVKDKLQPRLWDITSGAIHELARESQSAGIRLAVVVVPRAGLADSPQSRASTVRRFREIAAAVGVPLLDLSPTFDRKDLLALEIDAWDDHPNAEGHRMLFEALAHKLVGSANLYELLMGIEPPSRSLGLKAESPGRRDDVDRQLPSHEAGVGHP